MPMLGFPPLSSHGPTIPRLWASASGWSDRHSSSREGFTLASRQAEAGEAFNA
jgi:hypothetical protein